MSGISQLRRALLVDFASEEELDRIGRNLGVNRLPGMVDETYRCLLKTLSYLPKTTVYGLELLLECLFPGGGATIYEDLENFPNKVFILVKAVTGGTDVFEGKAFMTPTNFDVLPPTDPDATPPGASLGRGRRQFKVTSSTSQVTVGHTPTTVVDVLEQPYEQTLDMAVLPSADSPAWTFVTDAAGAEGTIFTLAANGSLQQTPSGPPSDNGGRYKLAILPDSIHKSVVRLSGWWRSTTLTTVTGRPWALRIDDASIGRQYGLFWSDLSIALANSPVTAVVSSTNAADLPRTDGTWNYLEIERRTEGDLYFISAKVNGRTIFSDVDSTLFAVSAVNEAAFGFVRNAGDSQDWVVQWDRVYLRVESWRNHWNITRRDGVFSGANDHLTSAAAMFLAGDVGKHIRIWTKGTGTSRVNLGLWRVKAFSAATDIQLEGVPYTGIVSVYTKATTWNPVLTEPAYVLPAGNYVDLLDPLFTPDDVNKAFDITGSALTNNRTGASAVKILEVVNAKRVRVNGAAFANEVKLNYQFRAFDGTTLGQFKAGTTIEWELADTGTFVGALLTVRDLFSAAGIYVEANYTKVLSAQTLRNEFIKNAGSAGAPPNVYYPFYLFDVDRATRQLMDEVTAAGVLPAYQREF